MANTIKPKRSYTSGVVPSGLSAGELAVNASNGKIWIGSSDGKSSVLVSSINLSDAVGSTTNISEGSNLYFTDARARSAVSSSATGLTYTSGTGVFSFTSGYSIPTTTSQSNWDTAYTNRITSLTTTGSSGAATLSSNVLNIPNHTIDGLLPSQASNSGKYLTTNGTSASWGTVSAGTAIPSGSMQMYAGSVTQSATGGVVTTNAPSGWLLANGDIISRSTYSALFTAIGTTYSAGDGSTTFGLPDMRSRTAIGVGTGSGLTARTLGGTVGEENTAIGSTNLPAHSHTFSPTGTLNSESSHTHTSANAGGHTHTGLNGWQPLVFVNTGGGAALSAGSSFQRYNFETVLNSAGDHGHGNTNSNTGHTHTFTPTAGQTTGNGPGTGASLTNMQPSIGVNYIIKT